MLSQVLQQHCALLKVWRKNPTKENGDKRKEMGKWELEGLLQNLKKGEQQPFSIV